MKKIFKILSIFVMVFVLFSCANPSSDSTSGSQPSGSKTPVETPTDDTEPSGPETPVETPSDDTEPSGPETPVETPSDDPVEETPEVPTYSVIFKHNLSSVDPRYLMCDEVTDFLNSLPEFKNLEEGTEVQLPWVLYGNVNLEEVSIGEISKTETDNSNYVFEPYLGYYDANIALSTDSSKRLRSVTIGNEDIVIQLFNCYAAPIEDYHQNSN